MKFYCSIKINKAIHKVSDAFIDPNSLNECHDGFIKKELISGILNTAGATSKLYYKKFELQETILENNLPFEFLALYEHKHMVNTMKVMLEAIDEHSTLFTTELEYTKIIGILPKILATLFPGMFKKQVYKWLEKFKTYTERY